MPRLLTLRGYKKRKIDMIKKDFMIPITKSQVDDINGLESENRVDAYARSIIWKALNEV